MIWRERHCDRRARPRRGFGLGRCDRLDAGRLTDVSRRRRRRGGLPIGGPPGRRRLRASTVSARCFDRLACEFVFESADYRRLDRRGRGPDKLAHLLELGHHGLALYAELFREFVNPNLRHCAPSTRPGFPGLSAGRGSACSVRRQLVLFIAACSSGAHYKSAFFRPVPPAVGTATARPAIPASRRIGTPRPSRPAVLPTGEGPAETPCGAGLVPSMPGCGADTHLGQAVAWPRREPVRLPLPPREPSQALPHALRTRCTSGPVRLACRPAYRAFAPAPPVVGPAAGSVVISGDAEAAAGPVSPVSGLMSIRQPVSRAASRAFCPSLPIASDSW